MTIEIVPEHEPRRAHVPPKPACLQIRLTDAEFEELTRQRDEAIGAMVRQICEERGADPAQATWTGCGCSGCYCACPDGPCQHQWDGPEYVEEEGGYLSSATCSRCGAVAAYHDMRVLP